MRLNARGGNSQSASYNGPAGEGLAIFFSQNTDAEQRWELEVFATFRDGQAESSIGRLFVSPPGATNPPGRQTRLIAIVVCPGAIGWRVNCKTTADYTEASDEPSDITLESSKCCTAPCGITRVSERYKYLAGSDVTPPFSVLAGQKITTVSGSANLGVDGTVQLGTGAPVITVPAGQTIQLEPGAGFLNIQTITFTNVVWVIELLESA